MKLNYQRLLEGKKCVVTAGAHGLGFAIAKLLAQHGAAVAICGRSHTGIESEKLLQKISPDSFFFQCDMELLEQVAAFGDAVLERFGVVDILVNVVGINKLQKVVDMDLQDFDRIHKVNVEASIVLIQKLVPEMIRRHLSGSLIHISSMNSLAPSPTTGSYSSSKGAINSLNKVLACELGQYGIRSNVICPGWIATTPMVQEIREAAERGIDGYEVLERYNGSSPLMAPARASDIANHVLFLASPMSSYITGCTLRGDGSAVMQAHECTFPEPENASQLRQAYYRTILQELGLQGTNDET